MPQIHLHAEPGDYAPVVLLPGDPNRATRIAARFDGGEATAPTADFEVVLALVDAAKANGLTYQVGPIVTGDYFYDPTPGGSGRWARRGYLSAEMEAAALFLLCMRERAKGRPVRAG